MSSLAAMLASRNDPCGPAAQARNLLLPGYNGVQAAMALPDVMVELACSILHLTLPMFIQRSPQGLYMDFLAC